MQPVPKAGLQGRSHEDSNCNPALLAAAFAAQPANALVLVDFATGVGSLNTSSPTELGRISRDGVPSDWSSQKAFPGTLNAATAYRYQLATISFAPNATQDVYYQISIDDPSAVMFGAAYLDSFKPREPGDQLSGRSGRD